MKNCRGPVIANGDTARTDGPYRMPGGELPAEEFFRMKNIPNRATIGVDIESGVRY